MRSCKQNKAVKIKIKHPTHNEILTLYEDSLQNVEEHLPVVSLWNINYDEADNKTLLPYLLRARRMNTLFRK